MPSRYAWWMVPRLPWHTSRAGSVYRFTHETSAMPSCAARCSITTHGTSGGSSGRNRPM
jgi:hypothetical protein